MITIIISIECLTNTHFIRGGHGTPLLNIVRADIPTSTAQATLTHRRTSTSWPGNRDAEEMSKERKEEENEKRKNEVIYKKLDR